MLVFGIVNIGVSRLSRFVRNSCWSIIYKHLNVPGILST